MIREITYGSEEYNACKRLRDEVLRKPLGLVLSAQDVEGEDKQIHIAAIGEDGIVFGIVILKPLSKTLLKLRQMAVSEAAQGKGLGAKLVQFAESAAKDKGYNAIETQARATARGFYEKLGYKVQGEEFTDIGIQHFMMKKTL